MHSRTTVPSRPCCPFSRSKGNALDILAREDLKRLPQGLDLGLAASHALLVVHARVHAARLQLVVVRQRRVQLPLRTLKVALRRRELSVLPRLELALVVSVRSLRRTVHAAVIHESLVLRRSAIFLRGRLTFEAREVGSDHLEHANDTAALRLLTLEARVN